MKNYVLTHWISDIQKPTIPGVYERDFGQRLYCAATPEYQYWDGKQWFYGQQTVAKTFREWKRNPEPCNSAHYWRGLAKDPNK